MSRQPLVTAVIPAYNAERFLERTLHSVVRQSYRRLEVLVIDDGSTDNTRQLAQAFADRDNRIRVISTQNGGVAVARNVGLHAARGSMVAFLDADDLWHPAKIEHQVTALKGDIALVYPLTRVIDSEDRVLQDAGVPSDGYAFARHLYVKGVGSGSSLLVRRDIALAVGGYDPVWVSCEDLDFELKIAARYAISTVPLFLVGYRVYPGNMSSNGRRMAQSIRAVVEKHLGVDPGLPRWAARTARVATLRFALETLWMGGHHTDYAAVLARLFRLDPKLASDYMARFVVRRLPWRTRKRRREAPEASERKLFFELAPETGAAERVAFFRNRERKIMAKLEALDEALATQNQLQCSPEKRRDEPQTVIAGK